MLSNPGAAEETQQNDIYQTTDQWKRKALHKIGETSGLWVSWPVKGRHLRHLKRGPGHR